MINAVIPACEPERLAALHRLLCLDTPPEERFDKIVQFAADEFDKPIVLLSLVDADRQWFKAKIGMEACETSREYSFCAHAILAEEIMLIRDASQDVRFVDNPFVTGAPYVRFYAGAPLKMADGMQVGTLCVMDTVPGTMDALNLAILGSLRDLIVQELAQQRADPAAA
jgi:GAF domain-containing protein